MGARSRAQPNSGISGEQVAECWHPPSLVEKRRALVGVIHDCAAADIVDRADGIFAWASQLEEAYLERIAVDGVSGAFVAVWAERLMNFYVVADGVSVYGRFRHAVALLVILVRVNVAGARGARLRVLLLSQVFRSGQLLLTDDVQIGILLELPDSQVGPGTVALVRVVRTGLVLADQSVVFIGLSLDAGLSLPLLEQLFLIRVQVLLRLH